MIYEFEVKPTRPANILHVKCERKRKKWELIKFLVPRTAQMVVACSTIGMTLRGQLEIGWEDMVTSSSLWTYED